MNDETAFVLRELFGQDPDWPTATCGECAWKIGEWKASPESKPHGLCRRSAFGGEIDLGWVNHDDTACPEFRRL